MEVAAEDVESECSVEPRAASDTEIVKKTDLHVEGDEDEEIEI